MTLMPARAPGDFAGPLPAGAGFIAASMPAALTLRFPQGEGDFPRGTGGVRRGEAGWPQGRRGLAAREEGAGRKRWGLEGGPCPARLFRGASARYSGVVRQPAVGLALAVSVS